MRIGNRLLLLVLAAIMLGVMVKVALWEQDALRSAEEAAATPPPTATPEPTPTPPSALLGKLLLTELMEKNRTTLSDGDGDCADWIELTNVSGETVELKGCRVSDREKRYGWVFPEKSLLPGERVLLFASGKDRAGDELHTNFALSEYDCVCLFDSEGQLLDSVPCAGCAADVSLARDEDGLWGESLYPTPGEANTADGYERCQQTLTAAGPLVLSEAAVKYYGRTIAGSSNDCDWVEIKNISDQPVLLSDYYLSDKDEEPQRFRLPAQTLKAGACILLVCGEPDISLYGTTPCTGFSLNASHEQLYLSDGTGRLIDRMNLRDIPFGASYGRLDGQPGFYYFSEPTPGRDNADGRRRVSAQPTALTPDGVFEGVESVTLELRGAGELRYTINGSAPTEKSELYTGPIEITETCVVSVKSFEDDALPSRTLSLSYFLNEGHTLPVVSFVAENFKEFGGIYTSGTKTHELPGVLSMYCGEDSFHANCAVNLNGETSLILTKKNMAVHFNGAYGQETLEHDLFGGGTTSFRSLLLRAGQDQFETSMRNELSHRLAEKADSAAIYQRCLFCILYIDGEYKGIYALEERPNRYLYAARAGVDPDSVEIFEAPAPYKSEFFTDVVQFVNSNDMRVDENYRQFCRCIDIDSLIDWLFLEGYCANTDLTSGNLRYARSYQADGRWHLLFYDLDVAFRVFDSIQKTLLNSYGISSIQVAGFSVPLMQNAEFRDRFLSRAAELLAGPLSNESVLEEIERMEEQLRPEIPRDFKRDGKDERSWNKSLDALKSMIRDRDWCQANIEGVCMNFSLSAEERAHYFGAIDKAQTR